MESINSRNNIYDCKISIWICLYPKLILLHPIQILCYLGAAIFSILQKDSRASIEVLKWITEKYTLLSICQDPSVLAADSPTYEFLAGMRESETNLNRRFSIQIFVNSRIVHSPILEKSSFWKRSRYLSFTNRRPEAEPRSLAER